MHAAPRDGRVSPSEAPGFGGARSALGFRYGSACRLHKAAEFAAVFSARRVLRGSYFDLHYRAGGPTSLPLGPRLGLVIAKKLAARAVQRNLLKRLGREAFRRVRSELPAYDLLLRLARPPGQSLDTLARRQWRTDIEQLLARLPR